MWGMCGVVVVVGLLCGGAARGYAYEDFQNQLRWAPLYLKKPYLTFLNTFNTPTWRTRNPISKREELQGQRYLRLPEGVPLGLACGACYQRSKTNTNLTVLVTGHEHRNHVHTHGPQHRHEYTVGNYECSITTVLTAPITSSGTLTCTLHRGRQVITETITFDPVQVEVEQPEVQLKESGDSSINLNCPKPPSPGPLVQVWHEEPETGVAVGHLPPSLTSRLHLARVAHDRTVTCSVYNILHPTKVARTTYRFLQASPGHQYQVASPFPGNEGDQGLVTGLSKTMVAIIVTTVLVGTIAIVVAVHHFVVALKSK